MGSAWSARVVAAVLTMSGCGTGPEVKDTSGNPEVRKTADAEAQLGKTVRVIGEAQNAKLSALVEGDDWRVYLIEVRAWPSPIEGKRVEVTGILGKNAAMTASGTPAAAGTTEPIYVLRDAVYILLDD